MQVNDAKSALKKSEWDMLGEDLGSTQILEHQTVEDIWKNSTHRLVTKLEGQTPEYFGAYLKIHSELLHGFDSWLGEWYMWQKQCFDGLGLDGKVVDAYGKLCSSWVDGITESMDMFESYTKIQADVASDAVKIGNNIFHTWIDMYGKMIMFWSFSRR